MNKPSGLPVWSVAWLLLLLVLMLNPGCASTPKADWNQRVGNFTFDDAVRELGPPVSSTKLSDGSTVAEWFLKAGSSMSFGFGTGIGPIGFGQTVTPPPKSHYLRLIFGPDGMLQHWEKFER